jgi:hypothetical protein
VCGSHAQARVAVAAIGLGKTVIAVGDLKLVGEERDRAAVWFASAATTTKHTLAVHRSFELQHPTVFTALRWCVDVDKSKWSLNLVRDSAGCGSQDVVIDGVAALVKFLTTVARLAGHRGLDGKFFGLPGSS